MASTRFRRSGFCSGCAAQPGLCFADARHGLAHARDEFAHTEIMVELFLEIGRRQALSREPRIDQQQNRLRQCG